MQKLTGTILSIILLVSCGAGKSNDSESGQPGHTDPDEPKIEAAAFDADSAYFYVEKQVKFGPRVPNTEAHRKAGDWMVAELKRHGATVKEQKMDLTAFDGTLLHARNIFGQYNPEATDRTLLIAHYDCRPWADQDSNPQKRLQPVDGANDGASGVGVLLEIARQMNATDCRKGIDILFVDAEDWGEEGSDDSWAMGARYFANNPMTPGYYPSRAIVVDMVGGKGAKFPVEYFSQESAPDLVNKIWNTAHSLGYDDIFPKRYGGGVTDDHVEFIKAGIPAVDIIEYHPGSGFNPHWHTSTDNMENIDKETLKAVGQTLMTIIK